MLDSIIFTYRSNKTKKVKGIEVSFTDKNVTAWGGMKLMKDMVDSIGIKDFMSGLDLSPLVNFRKGPIRLGEKQCRLLGLKDSATEKIQPTLTQFSPSL